MWDKLDLRIPFSSDFVNETQDGKYGSIDPALYDFPLYCAAVVVNGTTNYETLKCLTWQSIPSSLSSVAIGFFPSGNGFYNWPHVSVKASPSKILQGHNVFGTENIRSGAMQMLANLKIAFPKISAHLDFKASEVRYVDSTYSAFIPSSFYRSKIINLFDKLIPARSARSRYEGYLQLNPFSEYRRQKIYDKEQELLHDLGEARKKNDIARVAIMSDQKLQDFSTGRLRFEATTGYRAFENDGIPTNLYEFLKFHDWYESVHNEPLARLLWRRAFKKLFSQVEGHTLKLVDDSNIKLTIDAKLIKINASGKVCKRRANAVFNMYRQIKTEGYDQLARENSSTFYRNVSALVFCGISRAFLKSLDPNKPDTNVFHMINLIDVDFSAQRPDWYVEPTHGFNDHRRHLKLVS
jgi:II/X family phage/plasmid replication protein